ncbi:MAG: hypothetical protein KatS3mg009_0844 [Acidimicrobiia bacterium]|nr:MAG: hypothetical protein KatS3mg009_0844 [Acidimicrobiia bacterium]
MLDQVALGDPEHEVAGHGVHLPAAELHAVDAPVDAADDRVRVGVAGEQERVRHAHHRQVPVALPAPVAAARPALLARPQQVPHVVGEDAVLDEDVAPRGVPLVVDRERAPLARVGAVVDEGDARRRHPLADLPGEHRRVLRDVVGLETVAAGLVEQHTARAAAQHDGQLARRGRHRVEERHRASRGAAGDLLGLDVVEQLEAERAARRLVTGLHPRVAGRDALHPEPGAHLVVVREEAVGVRDLDPPARVGVRHGHRRDGAVLGPGGRVGPAQQLDLAVLADGLGEDRDLVGARDTRRRERHLAYAPAAVARGRRGRLGRRSQRGRREVRGVREPGRVAAHHPDPGTALAGRHHLLDPAVVVARTGAPSVLDEHLRELAAAAQRELEGRAQQVVVEHGRPRSWSSSPVTRCPRATPRGPRPVARRRLPGDEVCPLARGVPMVRTCR